MLSWNIQGKRNFTGYTPFSKIRPHLLNASADIFALQEMCDAEELLKNTVEFKQYQLFIPKLNKCRDGGAFGYNHNIILSKQPIIRSYELVFPTWNKKVFLENCSVSEIQVQEKILRIYNCHLGIFKVGITTRLKQLEYVLSDAINHNGPIIICGDMNVTIPKNYWKRKIIRAWHQEPKKEMIINGEFFMGDERELFNQKLNEFGFKEVGDLYTSTWSPVKSDLWEMFGLKLDWFATKNMNVTGHKVDSYVSDHKSIEVEALLS